MAASDRQIAANRENAKKSSGPCTPEGKQKVSRNAIKHGLLGRDAVLPTEDHNQFQAFSLALEQQLQPVRQLEGVLVESIAAYAWRLQRLVRIEKGILLQYTYTPAAEEAYRQAAKRERDAEEFGEMVESWQAKAGPGDEELTADFADVLREAMRRVQEAEERARAAEVVLNSPDGILGQAFITDAEGADALAKLARYEAHLQRSMFKALNELQHLQAVRSKPESTTPGKTSPPRELAQGNGDTPYGH